MINHLCREKLDNMNANKKVKIAAAAIAVALCCEEDNEKRRKEWVKPWLQRRNTHGFYSQLLSELRLVEVEIYKNYLRMTPENFNEILVLTRDDITKRDTPMREPIPPEIKLAVTIRFLATGTTFEDLSMCFRVHKSTIGKCEAIYRRLKNDYFQVKFILITNYISFVCKYLTKLRGIFSVAAMSEDICLWGAAGVYMLLGTAR